MMNIEEMTIEKPSASTTSDPCCSLPQPNGSVQHSTNLNYLSHPEAFLKELILNAPNVNLSRVELIKQEITANRYTMNSNMIALKLLQK